MGKIQNLYPKCVTCVIKNENGEILVLKHNKCKGKYTFPAGTMEPVEVEVDDGYKLTAIREMKEELDIDIDLMYNSEDGVRDNIVLIETTWAYYDRVDGHKVYWEHVCEICEWKGVIKNMEPDKHECIKWVKPDDVFKHPELYTYQTWSVVNTYYHDMWFRNDY